MKQRLVVGVVGLFLIVFAAAKSGAQQQVAPGKAPAGITWPSPALPDGPITLDTGIQHQVRLFVTKGLNQPWSMAFLGDGGILVTERPGRLRIVRNGVLDPKPVAGVPAVRAQGLGGLMDLALHPRFSQNKQIYFTYDKPSGNNGVLTLARARWDGAALTNVEDIFSALSSGSGSRIVFGRDGMIYMSVAVGDPPAAQQAQDLSTFAGKVLRLTDDGGIPTDNPFTATPGARPEIFTLGHRNMLGLAVHPVTGEIWECENGPNGGDEVNILKSGRNYGWPVVSYGRFYSGERVSVNPYKEGMEPPAIFWVPAIAVSGLTFYTGNKFPSWKNNLFVGSMRTGEVPRSGHLERVDFNDKWEELHREGMLRELQNRIRDVREGPDGFLYLLTAENDGALIRMEPSATN